MGSKRTKEDDVLKISTSVFVTNFPEQASAKDLWNACKQYGHVVDAFIPNKRSKAGKRFGFVRFIKVFDVERLVGNLCTGGLWVMIAFDSVEAKEKFLLSIGVLWNENTFIRIASKWGTLLNVENLEKENYHCKDFVFSLGKIEECEEVFKKDFGESDEEVQGENDISRNYFVMIQGREIGCLWQLLLIISVYAPQELSEKKSLWDYLCHVIDNWKGSVIIMGDFNEVRNKNERFGTIFNVHGANAFNSFYLMANSRGGSLEWMFLLHGSQNCFQRWSKLDRFLMSESLLSECPNLSAITLDRFLSDHRPILLCESTHDYGPIPFRFFHYWLEMEGFENFVNEVWCEAPVDNSNAIDHI
ncbi:RNA-directed DNA polymerase, eukaryota [Tanacetum coccineum]|uniref:RNA-directed DNA polymerase, eukaryota n=1 Tax=Tanacetum coccineum TaxID=301880 RepID=A0ABQ4X9Z6_9ASTR